MQILHPFAGSIQQYAEEIAVYHRPALADDTCKLTNFGSISVRQISDPGRQKLHLHPGYHGVRVAIFEDWRLPFVIAQFSP